MNELDAPEILGAARGAAPASDAPWTGDEARWPTVKQRTAVQHAVNRLLDALAPERPPAGPTETEPALQRIRSPRGCILQGAAAALSVSWFPANPLEPALGELEIVAWEGVVSRPGAARRGSAQARWRIELQPVQAAGEQWAWRTADGRCFDTDTLRARCESLVPAAGAR